MYEERRVSKNFLTEITDWFYQCVAVYAIARVAIARVAEEHGGTASNETTREDRLSRRRERDRLRMQRETSRERDARLKLTALLYI